MATRTISATLASDVVYVTGTINSVSVIWTRADTTRWEAVCDRSADDIYLVEITAINSAGLTATSTFTLYYGLHLITDRTADDVSSHTAKGCYTATDLNRVESAVQYLAVQLQAAPEDLRAHAAALGVAWDKLFNMPYDPEDYSLETKIDWAMTDLPTKTAMKRYLSNVESVVAAMESVYPTVSESVDPETGNPIITIPDGIPPTLPASMDKLTWEGANAIERSLEMLHDALQAEKTRIQSLIDLVPGSWLCHTGDIYAGEI